MRSIWCCGFFRDVFVNRSFSEYLMEGFGAHVSISVEAALVQAFFELQSLLVIVSESLHRE